MSLHPCTFALLFALLWQSVVVFGPLTAAQRAGELDHLIVHSQVASHHHHADKTLHMDEDAGPAVHLHADAGAGSAALLNATHPALADVRSVSPAQSPPARWLSATLEGPLRPPMPRA